MAVLWLAYSALVKLALWALAPASMKNVAARAVRVYLVMLIFLMGFVETGDDVTIRGLQLAQSFLDLAFGFQGRIADKLAGQLFHRAFNGFDTAFNLIFVHVALPWNSEIKV
jgi:hypothetical protein